jgi:hypothetical protein
VRRTRFLLPTALLALTLAGCRDSAGPDPLVDFTVDLFDIRDGPLPGVQSTVGSGTITVSGGFWTPCVALPAEIEGAAAVEGTEIELQVSWLGDQTSCVPAVENFVYQAVLGGLSPDTYHLRVVHIPGADAFAALDENVVVP